MTFFLLNCHFVFEIILICKLHFYACCMISSPVPLLYCWISIEINVGFKRNCGTPISMFLKVPNKRLKNGKRVVSLSPLNTPPPRPLQLE